MRRSGKTMAGAVKKAVPVKCVDVAGKDAERRAVVTMRIQGAEPFDLKILRYACL